jgi:cysteine desulfurase
MQLARKRGACVEVVPADPQGRVDLDMLAAMMDERVAALCIPAVSS